MLDIDCYKLTFALYILTFLMRRQIPQYIKLRFEFDLRVCGFKYMELSVDETQSDNCL